MIQRGKFCKKIWNGKTYGERREIQTKNSGRKGVRKSTYIVKTRRRKQGRVLRIKGGTIND